MDHVLRPIPLRGLLPLLALALAAGALIVWLVAFDNGQLSQTGTLLHELMHDGRHLLGVPCH